MKVLQINCVYKHGSTGKIVYDIHRSLLNDGYESVVCYGRGNKSREEYTYKCCGELYSKMNNLFSRITGIMYGGCILSTSRLIHIIEREEPDIVHLHCINGYFVNIYRLITYLKKKKIKTVLTLHAEFMYTANCGHSLGCDKWKTGCGNCPRLRKETKSFCLDKTALSWNKMKKAFEGFDNLIITSVSPWLQNRAQSSPILSEKNHITILNGVDTSVFRAYTNSTLKKELGLENKKIVFHTTAFFSDDKEHLKGGYYVIELARRFLNVDRNVIFLVAGKHDHLSNIPPNITFLGNIENQSVLAEYYSMSDVTVLTSKKETFSMLVAESLCCGTPVVAFEAGAPELIAIKEFSSFVPHGEVEKLADEIYLRLNAAKDDRENIAHVSSLKYGKDLMTKQYKELYERLIISTDNKAEIIKEEKIV